MNETENKLVELGYKKEREINIPKFPSKEIWYTKKYSSEDISIVIYLEDGKIDEDFCQIEIKGHYGFSNQTIIDNLHKLLTEALIILKKDLEALKNVKNQR